MLNKQLHLLAELYTLKTSTLKQRSEVDVRVAQELKNDRDFKYQISQLVQNTARDLAELKKKQEKDRTDSYSDLKSIEINFQNLRKYVLDSIKEVESKVGDFQSKMIGLMDSFNKLQEDVVLKHLTKQEFYHVYVKEVEQIDSIENRLTQRDDHFNFALETLKGQLRQEIQSVKKELTPEVPEVDPIKQQLDERFKVLKVDFDGLVKEIAILKKAVAYDQKKFENIYTLIERLKEGVK